MGNAEAALQRGRPDAGVVCAGRAVALMPADPISQVMLGKSLFASGDFVGALEAVRAASNLFGGAPEADDAIGALFSLIGRHDEALPRFQRAVARRPDVAQYLFNLASAERMNGQFELAETHCDAAIARNPDLALAWYLRADLRTQTAARNHIAPLLALINARRHDWRGEVLLRYTLAREYEDIGDDARAFEQVEAGANLQRRNQPSSAKFEIAEIDRIVKSHTQSWLATAPAGYAEANPIFVVGLPRIGTTLVERIIASHSAVASVGESGIFATNLTRAFADKRAAPPTRIFRAASISPTI
jgi:tetratricopeptide (TPR) repeat protein